MHLSTLGMNEGLESFRAKSCVSQREVGVSYALRGHVAGVRGWMGDTFLQTTESTAQSSGMFVVRV